MSNNKDQYKIILITVFAVIAVWTADAAYDSFTAHEGPFLTHLTEVSSHEPGLRLMTTFCLLLFGVIIWAIMGKRARAEATLKKHSAAIETSMDGIAIYDQNREYVYVNPAYASINGYVDPSELLGKTCHTAYADREMERIEKTIEPLLQKNGRWRGELVARRKNGSTYFQEVSITQLEDGGRVCIIHDITSRRRSRERLRRSERFLSTIFDSIRDPFCIFDKDFRIIRANESYANLKGRKTNELIGKKCHAVLHNSDTVCEGCVVNTSFHSSDPCAKDKMVTLNDGTGMWAEMYTYPIFDEDGNVSHVMEYTRDITDRKKTEDEKRRLIGKLEQLSRTDDLTCLMNRRALTDHLGYEIERAVRYKSELSLILCDIDNFKEINDTFGHDTGDRVLQTVSGLLKVILRKTDIAGRHGGDEFMLILPETSGKGAEGLADKLLDSVRETELRSKDGREVRITLSIGVASLAPGKDTMDSFIKRADDAMYLSKQNGRDRVSMVQA
jgi:diguanylate cyclase (GGDEF)-like protein/PAS domain S-box-containing protein